MSSRGAYSDGVLDRLSHRVLMYQIHVKSWSLKRVHKYAKQPQWKSNGNDESKEIDQRIAQGRLTCGLDVGDGDEPPLVPAGCLPSWMYPQTPLPPHLLLGKPGQGLSQSSIDTRTELAGV